MVNKENHLQLLIGGHSDKKEKHHQNYKQILVHHKLLKRIKESKTSKGETSFKLSTSTKQNDAFLWEGNPIENATRPKK